MPKEKDSASISTSSSLTSLRYSALWNCLWIPLLISLSKELNSAKAQSILLPGGFRHESSSCLSTDPTLYFRPVIGILSHPGDGASGRLNNDSNASYIAASYVKFVESAGARVIPLIYNEPREVLYEKLNLVNGVLFTGGWAKSGLYYETVQEIFEQILKKNDLGYHFPLFATCLGFELLHMIVSKDVNILERFNALNQPSTLQFTQNTKIEGTVFQRFPPDLLNKLTTDCIVMQNHQYGVSPEKFQKNPSLSSFLKILTTSTDEDDKVYVSTVQARNYPVTGVQWHPESSFELCCLRELMPLQSGVSVFDPDQTPEEWPYHEKNAFEWGSPMIPHTEDAIQVTQHVANFFISEARKSLNRPPVRKVLDNLIYNYSPSYSGKAGRGFDEVFIFS